uniref:SPK domain-containing protein n=1 Tax=Caenorhabditis tropicalis TaxID=1561998 RepID=A0A1I7TMI9_9PELO
MTDSLSTQMSRGRNAKRNKSTASVGSKKQRTQSTTSAKFQQSVDGFSTFLIAVSRLGKQGHEFTWHDLRKVYHKETQRHLTAEELNAIFSVKNKTKREIFELPQVKRFMISMDGSMMCRFRLIGDPEEYQTDYDELPPLMSSSVDSDVITQNSSSPSHSQSVSPVMSNEKSTAVSTELDDKTGGPTSDLSKSDKSPSQNSLVQQSSVTDDEGWVSGRDGHSDNSSPVGAVNDKDEVDGGSKMDMDDEVFEADNRVVSGSDNVDGSLVTDVTIVEEATVEQNFRKAETSYVSPIVMTESINAAFEAVIQSASNANVVLPETQNASKEAKVHATPRKVLSPPVAAERKTVVADELSTGQPIKKLIEKFDTAVNFAEHKVKAESPFAKSIYSQVLDEIGGNDQKINQEVFSKKQEEHGEAEVTNVIFRSASTHSSIIAQGKEQLAEFVAEQEAKHKEKSAVPANTTIEEVETAFCAKEQSSMSSLDREYFDSKTKKNEDLFEELGIRDTDGFQLRTVDSNGSDPASSEIITVIEAPQTNKIEEIRNRADSIESDADVPYSLCSEDEAEPMTMIEKSMKVSQSAEQLSTPKEEQKAKTVVVNVELDAKAKREPIVETHATVKDRIAELQAFVSKKQVPIAKVDSVEEKDDIVTLSRSEELPHMPLSASSSPSTGTVRRRQVKFMRGCCVVQ